MYNGSSYIRLSLFQLRLAASVERSMAAIVFSAAYCRRGPDCIRRPPFSSGYPPSRRVSCSMRPGSSQRREPFIAIDKIVKRNDADALEMTSRDRASRNWRARSVLSRRTNRRRFLFLLPSSTMQLVRR